MSDNKTIRGQHMGMTGKFTSKLALTALGLSASVAVMAYAAPDILSRVLEDTPFEFLVADTSLDTLPEPNGILPPPANSVLTANFSSTPINGVRRLALFEPAASALAATPIGAQASGQQPRQPRYVSGTRSANLIRTPVEARIETFPTVTLATAVEGALAGDDAGFQTVQGYLNQALGDKEQIQLRAEAILEAIGALSTDFDLTSIADAANLVMEASARAYWAAYMSPFVLDPNFRLMSDATGWDFGPDDIAPYEGFTRIGPGDSEIGGANLLAMADGIDTLLGPTLLSDGIEFPEYFNPQNLEDGTYRIFILTADMPGDIMPLYPFGVDFRRNGAHVNLVDTRATDSARPLLTLTTEGLARAGETTPISYNEGEVPATGFVLSTRAEVVDGRLELDFGQLGNQPTYITAAIIYPEELTITEELTNYLAEFLAQIQTAAGPDQDQDIGQILPLVDPASVFSDAAGGLPTLASQQQTANAFATPLALAATSLGGPGTLIDTGTETGGTGGGTETGGTGGGTETGGTGGGTETGGTGGGTETGGTGGGTETGGTGGGTETGGTETPPELLAEAGLYEPVLLGEDFTLDGCGTTIAAEILCTLTDTSAFELTWLLDGQILGTGLQLLLQTGEGTPFTQTGDYLITLQARFNSSLLGDSQFINLINGGSLFLPGDIILTSIDTALIRVVAPVPEPESLFVLLPALSAFGFLYRRRRRTHKEQHAQI